MKIYDPQTFALVVPTFEGTRFLKRALDYLRYIDFQGAIVLSDNSSGEHRRFVERCSEQYPDLRLEVLLYPAEITFLAKLVDTLGRTPARYVMFHAHDDFVVPENTEKCVEFLEANPGYSVCRGRIAGFSLHRNEAAASVGLAIRAHPMRPYEQDDPLERLLDHMKRYASTLYSVHRRELVAEAMRLTAAATPNVIFFQYLSSCISAVQGKVACLEDVFYVRQAHDDSWSRSLLNDYEHWPMLITSPRFSEYYQQFRAALCGLIREKTGIVDDIGAQIDRASIRLFERAYCGKQADNPAETTFLEKLKTLGTTEANSLKSVAEFATRYPETF